MSDVQDFDAIEWGEELEKLSAVNAKADASASRSFWGKTSRARTSLVLRKDLADFVKGCGPRFSIQIDASGLRMRITPNAETGKFEFSEFKSVVIFRFGHVERWPNSEFQSTDVEAVIHKGSCIVTFPHEWAVQGAEVKRLAAPQDPKVEPESIPAGVRKVLIVLTDSESVSHTYLPTALELSRSETAVWVEAAKKWLASLQPGVALINKQGSFFLSKYDRRRVRGLLDATK